LGVGRISRVPISKTPLDIPSVIVSIVAINLKNINVKSNHGFFRQISFPDFAMLTGIFEATGTTYITVEITPGAYLDDTELKIAQLN
jgi:hypothetical protein